MRPVPERLRRATRSRAGSLRTVSLRRRVTASSLLVLAAVLLAVGVLTDVLVAAQTRSDLQSRLEGRAATAVQLAGQGVRGAELVRRIDGPGVRVTLTTATGVYTSAGPGGGPGPDRDGPPARRGGDGGGGTTAGGTATGWCGRPSPTAPRSC